MHYNFTMSIVSASLPNEFAGQLHAMKFHSFYSVFLAIFCVTLLPASVAADRAWHLDRILTTFWSPPPAEDRYLQQVKREHYNLTWTNEIGLRAAERNGIKAILLEQAVIRLDALNHAESRAKLDALIDRVKGAPALEAYFIMDEPTVQQFPALGQLVRYIRQRDPSHLCFVNLLPCYAERGKLTTSWTSLTPYEDYLRSYMREVQPQLLSYDHYRFYNHSDSPDYFYNLATVSRAAQSAHIPFMNVVQACKFTNHWRTPSASELRWFAYTSIAYGAKGICYFLYWGPTAYGGIYQDGKASANAAAISAINKDVATISKVLFSKHLIHTYQTAPVPRGTESLPGRSPVQVTGGHFVISLFATRADLPPDTAMIVNRRHSRPAKGYVSFLHPVRLSRFDNSTGKWAERALIKPEQKLELELAAGDAAIFSF